MLNCPVVQKVSQEVEAQQLFLKAGGLEVMPAQNQRESALLQYLQLGILPEPLWPQLHDEQR